MVSWLTPLDSSFFISENIPMRYCMTLYLNWYKKYDKSKLKVIFYWIDLDISTLTYLIFDIFEVQDHTILHWKALRYEKNELGGLSYNTTFSICEDVLKSDNLLNKQGFFDSLMHTTVYIHMHPNVFRGKGFDNRFVLLATYPLHM